MKAYKFKLKTRKNPEFVERAQGTLDLCRELYNAALQERRDAWRSSKRVSITRSIQEKQLPEIKELRPDLKTVHSQVLQDVLANVDKSFENFFRRIKEQAKEPGYPRFKGKDWFDSFTYSQSGFCLDGTKLTLSKIGSVRLRLSRSIEGKLKTCSIKREADGWFVIFTAESTPKILAKTGKKIGIDVGLETFAALSNGEMIENPRFYRTAEAEIAEANRKLATKRRGSNNRKKAKIELAKAHKHIAEQRKDFAHKETKKLVDRFDEFHIEALNIRKMSEKKDESDFDALKKLQERGRRKSIHDAAWNLFLSVLSNKAENAGRKTIRKNPAYTSQTCSRCKKRLLKKIDLSVRTFLCPNCGFTMNRDTNAAVNILESTQIVPEKIKKPGYGKRKFGRTARTSDAPKNRKRREKIPPL